MGRRDRKRQKTREHIAETARRLFAERGFTGVTVAEIAEASDVSEQTVYNHFPTKEDLVFWRRGTFEAQLLTAIGDRPVGESALAAFKRFVIQPRGTPSGDEPASQHESDELRRSVMNRPELSAHERTVLDSPALQDRERTIIAGYTASLAALLSEDTGTPPDDVEPWVVASAMLGVTQALISYARRRAIAGAKPPQLAREVRLQAERAVKLLEDGLGGYAIKKG